MNKKLKDNGNTPSDPKTGNTKGHISSKAGMKNPDTKQYERKGKQEGIFLFAFLIWKKIYIKLSGW